MKQRLAVLDQVAGRLNALLIVIAIGLGVLDLTVLVGKGMMAAIAANITVAQVAAAGSSDAPGKSDSVPAAAAAAPAQH